MWFVQRGKSGVAPAREHVVDARVVGQVEVLAERAVSDALDVLRAQAGGAHERGQLRWPDEARIVVRALRQHARDIFGADHIATIPDVLAAVKALGFDAAKVKVIIHQMVTFLSGKEVIKFSKRSGSNYLLDELIETGFLP